MKTKLKKNYYTRKWQKVCDAVSLLHENGLITFHWVTIIMKKIAEILIKNGLIIVFNKDNNYYYELEYDETDN